MDVILLESVNRLGSFGDKVKVKPGFARNFLVPQKKALPATPANIRHFEDQKKEFQDRLKLKQDQAQNRADLLKTSSLRIEMNAHDDGKLYGSVGMREIIALFKEQDIEVAKNEIHLPDGPLRQAGDYHVTVQITIEIAVEVPIQVVALQRDSSSIKPEEITNG